MKDVKEEEEEGVEWTKDKERGQQRTMCSSSWTYQGYRGWPCTQYVSTCRCRTQVSLNVRKCTYSMCRKIWTGACLWTCPTPQASVFRSWVIGGKKKKHRQCWLLSQHTHLGSGCHGKRRADVIVCDAAVFGFVRISVLQRKSGTNPLMSSRKENKHVTSQRLQQQQDNLNRV